LKISLKWLREYVDWTGTPEELADRLTQNGLNVEEVAPFAISYPGVVVADVISREKHPDADKLSLCKIFDGQDHLQVVCGAPNVREGLKVLFARVGSVLPGDFKIKKSKIRGVESFGMICSSTELELGVDGSGIMELSPDLVAGTPADELYGYSDTVFDIEVTPNRPDWLSHLGIAREVAAITGGLLNVPEVWSQPLTGSEKIDFSLEIDDFADCPRYTAHFANDIKLGEAPRWMQNRLLAVGSRPINNIVDITNYVMLELGQPLHAFDQQKLNGRRIQVHRAQSGESFQTLDGKSHELKDTDLVIADAQGPVALAGVMGGANSEVTEATDAILLESAYFDAQRVRDCSRRLGIISDASYRFERDMDWDMVDFAARRALFFFQHHANATILPGSIDRQNPDRKETKPITLRVEQVNRLLGTKLNSPVIMAHLQALGFKSQPLGQARDHTSGTGQLTVQVPGFRRDVFGEVDLIEEVARMHGFDQIEVSRHFRGSAGVTRMKLDEVRRKLRSRITSLGYQEIITSTFIARRDIENLMIPDSDKRAHLLAVDNPNHGGETLLRSTLLPSLLHTARHNVNADCDLPLRVMQIGKSFHQRTADQSTGSERDDLLPVEHQELQVAIVGDLGTGIGDVPASLLELKALVEHVAVNNRLHIVLEADDSEPYLTNGGAWRLLTGSGRVVGEIGLVGDKVLANYDLDAPVCVAGIQLDIFEDEAEALRVSAFSRYPAVKRDLSLIAPVSVAYSKMRDLILDAAGPLLSRIDLFDVYTGESVGDGRKALGIRLKFQSVKGNLKSKAVDKAITAVTGRLQEELDVTLRS
jgi:phenylalanyl-tRNA synthetase beta chain